ncbi:uncharacterized protein TNCV_4966481 [Trichonephila clavipes]|nr:uncharacterized protein TNCV_4966481 [Trichonephila clavipes]
MPLRRFRRQYEIERGKIIGMMEAEWSAKRIAHQLGLSNRVLKDIWDHGTYCVCCPSHPTIDASVWSGAVHEETGLQRNETRSSLVTRARESRFNLSSDDNRDRVWRPREARLNPAFALERHTTPTAGVMVWGTIA